MLRDVNLNFIAKAVFLEIMFPNILTAFTIEDLFILVRQPHS